MMERRMGLEAAKQQARNMAAAVRPYAGAVVEPLFAAMSEQFVAAPAPAPAAAALPARPVGGGYGGYGSGAGHGGGGYGGNFGSAGAGTSRGRH
ncbi:hypothetical protein FOA52_005920 [Chlamydomonas sp. UWO 241]|nr:hypothetical protein FOA52_005920 [Chlamydomonas sp. UWO 241]